MKKRHIWQLFCFAWIIEVCSIPVSGFAVKWEIKSMIWFHKFMGAKLKNKTFLWKRDMLACKSFKITYFPEFPLLAMKTKVWVRPSFVENILRYKKCKENVKTSALCRASFALFPFSETERERFEKCKCHIFEFVTENDNFSKAHPQIGKNQQKVAKPLACEISRWDFIWECFIKM